jgi:glycosyltransferase involved in cell wall biosynthesis
MKIGIAIEETWDFLHDLYGDLNKYHQVSVFNRRTTQWPIFRDRRKRYLFSQDLSQFLSQNDIVFFEWASELLVAATKLPKTCGIVTRLHRYEMYQWVDKVDWNKVDKIILVTRSKQEEFIKRFPEHAHRSVVINESVSLEKFPFHPKPFGGDIGILCHLTPRKRVYELILDFYELTKNGRRFHLHIGGDSHPSYGDYMEAMQWLVKDLELESDVTFYGPVTNTRDWYHNIDIFISNSYSEGLQVALLEAMASGCYCLSHRWSGVDELLPRENLYYTGNELQNLILDFSEKSEEGKLAFKKSMYQLVSTNCNAVNISAQIRQVIEEVNAIKLLFGQ